MSQPRLPPPPRDMDGLNAYFAEHLPGLQRELRQERERLPRPEVPQKGELRRTLDPLAEAIRRSDDPSFRALADDVRRGVADERDLRRHPEFGRAMLALAREHHHEDR